MKLLLKAILILISIIVLIYFLWNSPISINLVIEASEFKTQDMRVEFDNVLVFNDSVNTGTFLRESIELNDVSNGFHTVQVETVMGNAQFSKRFFIFFNRTIVIEYFKDENSAQSYFRGRSIIGDFFPD